MLFQVKFEVQALEKQLKALNSQIYANQQAIHVLKAEWGHLNDPRRLAELNGRYLQLQPVEARQLARIEDIPMPVAVPPAPELASMEGPATVAPGAGSSVAPVTRSTPEPPARAAAPAPRPAAAGALFATLARFVREDDDGGER
ncbi:MAG: hypothetical protein IRY94_07375 [Rhodospirillaceae bacterium]|nr:hypothetical protein [Rhodospirillaceae bacterium]